MNSLRNALATMLVWGVLAGPPLLEAQARPASTAPASGTEDAALDALLDRGIAHYRAGAYRDAIVNLSSVVNAKPDLADAQLYLSLSHLALGDDEMAQRHLGELKALPVTPRLREQVGTVLEVMQAGPVSPALRRFIAAALEDTMPVQRPSRRPALVDSVLRRNFPYVP